MKQIDKRLFLGVMATLIICGSFIALTILTYAYFDGWNDAERWAHFGDFVGGISGSILGFANLILLVVISYQLADRDDKRNLYPLQHAALMRFQEFMNNLPKPRRLYSEKELETFREAHENIAPIISELAGLFPGSKHLLINLSYQLWQFGHRIDRYAATNKFDPNLIGALLDDYQTNIESTYGRTLLSMRQEML